MPNSHISIYNDFRGPNNSLTVREASMNLSIAEATSIIQRGAAEAIVVGATGTRLHPLRTTHITLAEKLASEQEDPTRMSRPFDATCDGMVAGEGAGAVLLESWEHAEARGAKIWGEIIGQGASMVGPSRPPARDFYRLAVAASLRAALRSAGDRLPQHWHLHAHGLSSPEQDQSESLAIGEVLKPHGAIPVTAAKSYFGNLGAGSGAVEFISSLLALEHGTLFPIRNLNTRLPQLDWTPAELGQDAGQGFIHSSFTLQGQAASIAVRAA
tara:strand:+ start:65 stop:874 length:810 start_codon:yes stop_codon:yes gene_type:complete